MNQKTENTGFFLSRIILIIAIGFLFFLSGEKKDHHHNPVNNIITVVEFKTSPQAILTVAGEIPPFVWFTLSNDQKTDLAFNSFSKISFSQLVTQQLVNCKIAYFNAKPLIKKSGNYSSLPRYPDEYPSFS